MGQGNIYRRRVKVFTLAMKIYLDYKALQQREKWINNSKRAVLWDRAHERNAKRVLNAIIELGGLWVKLGQYLSTRVDVFPQAYISQLKQLQDSLPPRPLEEVCQCIQKELGKSIDELFSYFDKNPLASASIAQVHRATLAIGKNVVVKVQHEGIKTVILEDLKNAKSIVDWIAWAEPQYDFHPILDEWCKEAPKELDFINEAENTRTVARNLQCNKKHDDSNLVSTNKVDVLIPEVIQSTEKVLILEYMDGVRLNDLDSLEASGANKQKIVEEITRAYAHQIFVDGFFNGDPHPGNFLVRKEPPHRPILLDFGLTKKLPTSMKQALAKMFLASAEGDHVALLSALAEMGLKLRLDMPEKAMEVAKVFFRASTPASEALDNMKSFAEQRTKNMKARQEKTNVDEKVKQFNLVEAFPGELLIFTRVVNLLRGLSSTMNVRIVYQEIMRPFAESVLKGYIDKGPETNAQWINDTLAHSEVERKLRKLLFELGDAKKILGIQVCAYKDGEVVIDTAAGVLGKYDPRPVQPDSLFPIFSATKGITAGMLHWLVDNGKLKLDENVDNIWPGFGASRKHIIRVHHVLNHTSGLHNALANLIEENPSLLCNWDECLNRIAKAEPETEPGQQQFYHYMSFGWLCGGIIEQASGKKFQEILEEGIVKPLNIEGEMYIGIPPGVESRLATLTLDKNDLSRLSEMDNFPELPTSFQLENIAQMATALPVVFNMLPVRRAIVPAANGHCSARALARYYAALVDRGVIPPPHSSSSKPLLGSHTHIPKFPSQKPSNKWKKSHQVSGCLKIQSNDDDDNKLKWSRYSNGVRQSGNDLCTRVVGNGSTSRGNSRSKNIARIFTNLGIHDKFLGVGECANLALPNGKFGLGFRRFRSTDGSITGFGHLGMDGSTGFCDVKNRFAIAVTLNKMSFGEVSRKIIQLVCSELNVPVPQDYSGEGEVGWQYNIGRPLIN